MLFRIYAQRASILFDRKPLFGRGVCCPIRLHIGAVRLWDGTSGGGSPDWTK